MDSSHFIAQRTSYKISIVLIERVEGDGVEGDAVILLTRIKLEENNSYNIMRHNMYVLWYYYMWKWINCPTCLTGYGWSKG